MFPDGGCQPQTLGEKLKPKTLEDQRMNGDQEKSNGYTAAGLVELFPMGGLCYYGGLFREKPLKRWK